MFRPLSDWSWRLESATGCEVLLELCKSRLHTFPDLGSKVKNHQTSIKETKKLMVIYGDLHGYIYISQARNSTAKCGSVFRSVAATMLESFPNSGLVSHEPSSYWMLLGYPILTSTHLNNLNRTQHCCHKYSQVASESCEFGSRQSFSIAETLEQYHGSLAVQQ